MACGDNIMSPEEIIIYTKKLLHFVDENVVNEITKEYGAFITNMNITSGLIPHSIAVITPIKDTALTMNSEDILNTLADVIVDTANSIDNMKPLLVFPTPRKLYHRKNTIIRLWRFMAPKYEQVIIFIYLYMC